MQKPQRFWNSCHPHNINWLPTYYKKMWDFHPNYSPISWRKSVIYLSNYFFFATFSWPYPQKSLCTNFSIQINQFRFILLRLDQINLALFRRFRDNTGDPTNRTAKIASKSSPSLSLVWLLSVLSSFRAPPLAEAHGASDIYLYIGMERVTSTSSRNMKGMHWKSQCGCCISLGGASLRAYWHTLFFAFLW